MKTNLPVQFKEKTHEGATAARTNAEQQLRRSVMACLLWETGFYESGIAVADRIKDLVEKCSPDVVAKIAIEARSKQHLRHIPLLIVRHMAALATHKHLVAKTLAEVIQRPDELAEFIAIYWKEGRCPVSAQVKKGLAKAFPKFNEYSLAKYNQDGAVKLRDVLFICHASPDSRYADIGSGLVVERTYKNGSKKKILRHADSLYAKIVNQTLKTPDTWEVSLSGGADKKEVFERLMSEEKLGGLAFLRNLRNMQEAGVNTSLVAQYSQVVKLDRVLPFRFIAAARAVPIWEPMIEMMMLRSLADQPKLPGKTVIVVDNSGSMNGAKVSEKSDIDRSDAACALAILIREIAEEPVIIGFGTHAAIVPARRGFALAEAIKRGPGGGTKTQKALDLASLQGYDRIIVITDEQSHQQISAPKCQKAYFVNVAVCKNGIGYGPWTHIDGWSESILDYIRSVED